MAAVQAGSTQTTWQDEAHRVAAGVRRRVLRHVIDNNDTSRIAKQAGSKLHRLVWIGNIHNEKAPGGDNIQPRFADEHVRRKVGKAFASGTA